MCSEKSSAGSFMPSAAIHWIGVVSCGLLLAGVGTQGTVAAQVCDPLTAAAVDLVNAPSPTVETEKRLKELIACAAEIRGEIAGLGLELGPFRRASVVTMRFGRNGPVNKGLPEVPFGVSNDGKPQDDEQVRVPKSESWSFCATTGMEVSDHSRASSCGIAQSSGGG